MEFADYSNLSQPLVHLRVIMHCNLFTKYTYYLINIGGNSIFTFTACVTMTHVSVLSGATNAPATGYICRSCCFGVTDKNLTGGPCTQFAH